MKENYNKLWDRQKELPPTATYYIVMVRPKGSFTWTQAGHSLPVLGCAERDAEEIRKDQGGKWDVVVVPIELPRMPSEHAYSEA